MTGVATGDFLIRLVLQLQIVIDGRGRTGAGRGRRELAIVLIGDFEQIVSRGETRVAALRPLCRPLLAAAALAPRFWSAFAAAPTTTTAAATATSSTSRFAIVGRLAWGQVLCGPGRNVVIHVRQFVEYVIEVRRSGKQVIVVVEIPRRGHSRATWGGGPTFVAAFTPASSPTTTAAPPWASVARAVAIVAARTALDARFALSVTLSITLCFALGRFRGWLFVENQIRLVIYVVIQDGTIFLVVVISFGRRRRVRTPFFATIGETKHVHVARLLAKQVVQRRPGSGRRLNRRRFRRNRARARCARRLCRRRWGRRCGRFGGGFQSQLAGDRGPASGGLGRLLWLCRRLLAGWRRRGLRRGRFTRGRRFRRSRQP